MRSGWNRPPLVGSSAIDAGFSAWMTAPRTPVRPVSSGGLPGRKAFIRSRDSPATNVDRAMRVRLSESRAFSPGRSIKLVNHYPAAVPGDYGQPPRYLPRATLAYGYRKNNYNDYVGPALIAHLYRVQGQLVNRRAAHLPEPSP